MHVCLLKVYTVCSKFTLSLHISEPAVFFRKTAGSKVNSVQTRCKSSANCVNLCKFCVNQKAQKFAQCKLSKLVFNEQTLVKHGANPDILVSGSQNIIGAANLNSVHTGFVQVQLHLHRRLHLHVVLASEEAAAERGPGLVVGLPSLRLGPRSRS